MTPLKVSHFEQGFADLATEGCWVRGTLETLWTTAKIPTFNCPKRPRPAWKNLTLRVPLLLFLLVRLFVFGVFGVFVVFSPAFFCSHVLVIVFGVRMCFFGVRTCFVLFCFVGSCFSPFFSAFSPQGTWATPSPSSSSRPSSRRPWRC